MKRSGPSFRQQQVELKTCPACHGRGVVSGLFHEMPCPDCESSGYVAKDADLALSVQDLILQLRLECNEKATEIERLRRQLLNTSPTENKHGPMGTYYRGD
ncbi:hypothetical protein [Marinobacter nauticus]|uniref:hypothetical protein n=1 Tax=Marinobacter nauticus TaxID=2743 RepID=UPI000EB4B758|nr:hypothetical protein [Marinobacter nauticus]RKR79197.1 hypothetical protein C7436_0635 [Marinobacter nauticus]